MNTSETDHALRSAVFQAVPSGILPDAYRPRNPPDQLWTFTIGLQTPGSPDFRNVHSYSRSFTIIHNEISLRNLLWTQATRLSSRAKEICLTSYIKVILYRY